MKEKMDSKNKNKFNLNPRDLIDASKPDYKSVMPKVWTNNDYFHVL